MRGKMKKKLKRARNICSICGCYEKIIRKESDGRLIGECQWKPNESKTDKEKQEQTIVKQNAHLKAIHRNITKKPTTLIKPDD